MIYGKIQYTILNMFMENTNDPLTNPGDTAEMSAPYSRRPNERPHASATEWEEASANGRPRGLAYALWLQLWHWDAETVWGDLLKETRNCGYDGEIE